MKLNYKKTIYVGLAFMLISMFWSSYDSLIGKILIDKFGFNQTLSGFVLALDNIFALFMLPFFGALSDKSNSKRGRRTPFIVIGTVVAAFALVGLAFVDNYQTIKINDESSVVSEYDHIKDIDNKVSDWVIVYNQLDDATYKTKLGEILDGYISTGYDEETTLSLADTYDIKEAYNLYLRGLAWEQTTSDWSTFAVFIVILLIALIAMSTFRSPAVALMPDVTIKPLRSKANAIINLMGALGAAIFLVLSMVLGIDKYSYVNYSWAFIIIGGLMIVFLLIFLYKVREPKLVEERIKLEETLGIAEDNIETVENEKLPKDKLISLVLILFSVFFWFMGYNAVTSKLSDYAPKILNMGFSAALLIANVTAILAFIPIGIISSKIGRKKTILFGVTLLAFCFGSVYFITPNTGFLLYVILGLTGIAWASINVNSYPMVVELSKGSNVGRYTGYYYAFSMAAQAITPLLSGMFMDLFGRKVLFPYATIAVLIALGTMLFVKHGDVKPEAKQSLLEHLDVED